MLIFEIHLLRATDLKSHAMRSKLLSLHLVHTILTSHMYIFFTPAPVLFSPGTATKADPNAVAFIHAVKQYLCLSLSRNAVSVVPQVFDISLEIFGRVLLGLRTVLKVSLTYLVVSVRGQHETKEFLSNYRKSCRSSSLK